MYYKEVLFQEVSVHIFFLVLAIPTRDFYFKAINLVSMGPLKCVQLLLFAEQAFFIVFVIPQYT